MLKAIKYYYNQDFLKDAQWDETHGRITSLLHGLKESGRIANLTIEELRKAFPTRDAEQQLFDRLKDFSIRHHVGLAREFGSRRHGFCYLPSQFLLLLEDGELKEVFPHEIHGMTIDVLSFLEPFTRGEPWTQYFVPPGRKTKHEDLVEKIVGNPAILEPGLELTGRNVHLSGDFSERGYVDLVFRDKKSCHLLVEIKLKPDEFDKAIGQILKYRELFAAQNFIDKNRVRIGIASLVIPTQSHNICKKIGIVCFELRD